MTSNEEIHINRFTEAPDNGIIAYGFVYEQDILYEKAILIIRLDSNLNVLWTKQLRPNFTGGNNQLALSLRAIHCDNAGNVYCSFRLENGYYPRENFFVALSPSGNMLWHHAAPQYFGPDFSFETNAITVINNKVYFLGASTADTTLNFQRVHRPGFVSFVFDKQSGTFLIGKKNYIPYLSYYSSISNSSNNNQIELSPDNGKFKYAFQESRYVPPLSDEHNIIVFDLDSTLAPTNTRKLRGKISEYMRLNFCFSKSGLMAVANRTPATNFAVLDANYNYVISKNIGTSVYATPDITKLDIYKDSTLSLAVKNGLLSPNVMQVDIPLYTTIPNQTCIGTDTSFFTIEPVALQTSDMILPLVSNVVQAIDAPMQSADYSMQKQELCKVKSICNTLNIKGDSSYCTNTIHTYVAKKNTGCWKNVTWSVIPGTEILSKTDSSITIQFANSSSGFIKTQLEGCTVADSIFVNVYAPVTDFTLGNDQTICPGESITLSAPSGHKSYRWQTNDTASSITVTKKGTYSVQVFDHCGNEKKDTIVIDVANKTLAIGKDTSICLLDSVVLLADTYFSNYNWLPSILSSDNRSFYLSPKQTTSYTLQAKDSWGCDWSQQFSINVQKCENKIWFASAFTPNDDGKNDLYKPAVEGRLEFYQFSIYNRWGQLVFTTKDKNQAWDGYIKGTLSPKGAYAWLCNYRFRNEAMKTAKGTFSLLY